MQERKGIVSGSVAFTSLGMMIGTLSATIAEIAATAILSKSTDWSANQIFCVIVLANECYSWGLLWFLRRIGDIEWQFDCNTSMRHLLPRLFLLVGICIVATDVMANETTDPVAFSFIWFPLFWLLMPCSMMVDVEVRRPLKLPFLANWINRLRDRRLADKRVTVVLTWRVAVAVTTATATTTTATTPLSRNTLTSLLKCSLRTNKQSPINKPIKMQRLSRQKLCKLNRLTTTAAATTIREQKKVLSLLLLPHNQIIQK